VEVAKIKRLAQDELDTTSQVKLCATGHQLGRGLCRDRVSGRCNLL